MFKLSTTDFRFRTALVVAAGLMSLSGFTNQGDYADSQAKSSMASEAPTNSHPVASETVLDSTAKPKDQATETAAHAVPKRHSESH